MPAGDALERVELAEAQLDNVRAQQQHLSSLKAKWGFLKS